MIGLAQGRHRFSLDTLAARLTSRRKQLPVVIHAVLTVILRVEVTRRQLLRTSFALEAFQMQIFVISQFYGLTFAFLLASLTSQLSHSESSSEIVS